TRSPAATSPARLLNRSSGAGSQSRSIATTWTALPCGSRTCNTSLQASRAVGSRPRSTTLSTRAVEFGADMSNVVPLRYVARAGLLPELTRQTYDSLYKAVREVILNSVDAGASRVVVDLSAVEADGSLEITDDGVGMTLTDLQQSFMSLG